MRVKILDLGTTERLTFRLQVGASKATQTQTPMTEIAFDMLRIEGIIFRSQGRRGGGSWKRLAPDTVRKKGSSRILFTDDAKESYSSIGNNALFRSVSELGAPFQILHVTNTAINFGTDRPWAFVHQHGSRKRNIRARPFIRFPPFDIIRWNNIMADHLMGPFKAG